MVPATTRRRALDPLLQVRMVVRTFTRNPDTATQAPPSTGSLWATAAPNQESRCRVRSARRCRVPYSTPGTRRDTKVIARHVDDLRTEFPQMRGLSQRNLVYMRTFASEFPAPIAQRLVLGTALEPCQREPASPRRIRTIGAKHQDVIRPRATSCTRRTQCVQRMYCTQDWQLNRKCVVHVRNRITLLDRSQD